MTPHDDIQPYPAGASSFKGFLGWLVFLLALAALVGFFSGAGVPRPSGEVKAPPNVALDSYRQLILGPGTSSR